MKNEKSVAGLILPLFMLGFAAVYWFANQHVPAQDMRMVTPLTVALALLSLIQITRWMRGRDADGGPSLSIEKLRKPVSLIAATVILLVGASHDFPIAAALFLAVSMPALGMRRPQVIAPVAILFPLIIFYAFTTLGVPLASFWMEL